MNYAEYYTLVFKYEEKESELGNVPADKYSYIELLADVYKMFEIQSDFISVMAGNGLAVETDWDLLFMFEMYKNNPVIPFTIRTKHVALSVEMPGDNRKSKVCRVGPGNTGQFCIGREAKNVNMSFVDVRMASVGSVIGGRRNTAPVHYVGVSSGGGSVKMGRGSATVGRGSSTVGRGSSNVRKGSVRGKRRARAAPNDDAPPVSDSEIEFTDNDDEDRLEHGYEMSSDNEDELDDDIGDIEEDDDGLSDICSDKDDENDDPIKQKPYKDPFKGVYANPFHYKKGEDIAFQVGQVFKDVTAIKEALRDYAVKGGCEIHKKKNDNRRETTTWGAEGCDWRFNASTLANDMTLC
ncbi:hypothetical protein GH714_019665 [Hevea brasiliensis]|uniref:Transposase MuDR plant domain-containing protein n=1 Tax=Hevea brasiliensis TaxID=3981 RepID=A0A6A6K5Z1_HEVBR|nr:hypothetical protein GH714_019665 [Hevea brasiliensis]